MLLPSMVAECTAAVFLSLNFGLPLNASIFRYAGTFLAGLTTAAVLELRGRAAFLQRVCANAC